jgi:calcium-independent phospholipase A2-gamma
MESDTLYTFMMLTRHNRFVVALDADAITPVHFTDYYKPGESTMFDEVKIWEAACATSAATTFFKPVKIMSGGVPRTFVDGALGANNPVNRLWIEAEAQFPGAPLEAQIRCLLSIGTGKPALISFGDTVSGLLNSVKKIATETQRTADTFHDMHRTLADRDSYFRFNPPYIDEVGLHEAGKRAIVEARTAAYTEDPEVKMAMERFRQAVGEEQSASVHLRSRLQQIFLDDISCRASF